MIGLHVLLLGMLLAPLSTTAERLVHRRAGAPSIVVERIEVHVDGLRVFSRRSGLDETQLIPWDRVSGVDKAADGPEPAGLAARLQVGELLWRGRTRLLRGDARLAAPAFEAAWESLSTERSEAAALAAEGLIRASIAREMPHEALVPTLTLASLNGAGFQTDRFAELAPLFDAETGLVADLPPVLSAAQLAEVIPQLDTWIASSSGEGRVRGKLLRAILLGESIDGDGFGSESDGKGIAFLRLIAEVGAGDETVRARARKRLQLLAKDAPLWQQAWAAFFVGRSLIELETDEALRLLGILQLLHIPPLGAAAPGGLAPRSLLLAARTAAELGRDREAAILESLILVSPSPTNGALEISP